MQYRRLVSLILMMLLLASSFAPLVTAQEATPVTEDQIEAPGEDLGPSPDIVSEPTSDVPDEPDTDDALPQEPSQDSTPEHLLEQQSTLLSPNQTEPPTLQLDNSTDDRVVPVSYTLSVQAPIGTEIGAFVGADCEGDPDASWHDPVPGEIGYSVPVTGSFQLRWAGDDLTRGNCVTITWAESPTLLIDGSLENRQAPRSYTLNVSAPSGAQFASFSGAGCIPGNIRGPFWGSVPGGVFSLTDGMTSYQTRWGSDNDTRGNCINIAWSGTPTMSVDGTTGDRVIPAGQSVSPSPPPRAQYAVFEGAGCKGTPIGGWIASPNPYSVDENSTVSFQARWVAFTNRLSNCVNVTWAESPTMLADGATEDKQVPVNQMVALSATGDAPWAFFEGAGCQGIPQTAWAATAFSMSMNEDRILSFQARWGDDDSSRGNCVTVTWAANPTLVINGSTTQLQLPPSVAAVMYPPEGSQLGIFAGDVCDENSTDFSWTVTDEFSIGLPAGDVASFQLRWGYDNATRGNCVTVTWAATPTLLVNGSTDDQVLPILGSAAFDPPVDAQLAVFEGEGCVDSSIYVGWTNSSSFALAHESAVVLSFQLRWGTDDLTRGNCVTISWVAISVPVLETRICGNDNDVITLPGLQTGIEVDDLGWNQNQRTITLLAVGGYHFPENQQTVFTFDDEGPCETAPPLPPVHTEVCGSTDDDVLVPAQPIHVLVSSSGAWSDDGTWAVTFSAEDDYILPADAQTEYVFTNSSDPCPTDAPVPPVQIAVCGPNNDRVIVPDDQPAGVTLDSIGSWLDNHRVVTFAVDPEFQTDGQTTFTLTDAAEQCPPDTFTVTVHANTSDNGSIVGAEWVVYAPVAAQIPMTEPYLQGVVGEGNRIVLEDILPGQYRLTIDADGYEPVDTLITISADVTEISISITALQSATASPVPTVQPTSEPTGEPTSAPAAVTGLPSTGSGSGPNGIVLIAASLIATVMLAVMGYRRNVALL